MLGLLIILKTIKIQLFFLLPKNACLSLEKKIVFENEPHIYNF